MMGHTRKSLRWSEIGNERMKRCRKIKEARLINQGTRLFGARFILLSLQVSQSMSKVRWESPFAKSFSFSLEVVTKCGILSQKTQNTF